MNITAWSNKWLNRVYKSIAILLVLFAVIISGFRLLLPYAYHYKTDLQNYVNNNYQTNIEIGSLSMDWQKFGPVLVANNVSLLSTDAVAVFIDNVDIKVNFWLSLRHRTFITQGFTLDGAKIFVDQTLLAQNAGANSNQAIYRRISDLFLLQVNKFSLADSQLIVRSAHGDKEISIDHLNWLNQGNRHRASGSIIDVNVTENSVNLQLDMQGGAIDNMTGQVYVNATQVSIHPWLDDWLLLDDKDTYSTVNADVWLNVDQGDLVDMQVELSDSVMGWQQNGDSQEFKLTKGSFYGRFGDIVTQWHSSGLSFVVNDHTWQPVFVNGTVMGSTLDTYISQIDLGDIAKLAPLLTKEPESLAKLHQLNPEGQLADIHLWKTPTMFAATAELEDYQQTSVGSVPGLKNINAELMLKGNQLFAKVASKEAALDFGGLFNDPLAYDALSADVNVTWQDSDLTVDVDNTTFSSADLDLSAQASVVIPNDAPPSMALFADLVQRDVKLANQYYPNQYMGGDLVDYLNRSLKSGRIAQGRVLFNGQFKDFPFNNNEGIFVVDAELVDAEFEFEKAWPSISQMAANLSFINNSMAITARGGYLGQLAVGGTTAVIDDLKQEQLLVINAAFNKESPRRIHQLLNQSPLQNSVGATLDQLTIIGDVTGKMQIDVPLKHANDTVAYGEIAFVDNQLELATPDMSFTKINGQLNFENEVITTNDIALTWRGMPLSLKVSGNDKDDYYLTNIDIDAKWQQGQWQQQLPESLKDYASGDVNWQGNIALNMHKGGGFSYQAKVESDLVGTRFSLPKPYEKAAEESENVLAEVSGQLDKSTITAQIGDQLSFYGVLDHKSTQFQRSHLVLGNEAMLLPMDGFHITTKLRQADILDWEPLIQDILASLSQDSQQSDVALFPSPERIRGNIDTVDLFGHSLSNVSFNLLDQTDWWLLRLTAKEARSEIKFFPNWLEQGISIDADFIHFASNMSEAGDGGANADSDAKNKSEASAEAQSQVQTEPLPQLLDYQQSLEIFSSVPKVELVCDSCKVGSIDLGEVSFTITHDDQRLLLNNFVAKRGKTRANLSGEWLLTPEKSQTSIEGELRVSSLEREFENLGYASIIKDSGMKGEYQINWNGAPQEFALPRLNGDFKLDIDDGYLADVSDKGVRIFSVLSLQSLVRKLTLDFRDIFADGMFYSSIRSRGQIKDGVLYTDKTEMKGTAGDLVVKGNTKLSEGLLDYRMSYKPNLTSSLPVLAWIATLNPVTFLAGLAIDEVITSSVVSELNFELTGSINDPNFKEVNRKSRDVSVGSSKPPQFVENTTAPSPALNSDKKKNLTPPSPIELNEGNGVDGRLL
ncbi:MAG: TIGR02099 family protein [Thalassotalea sp.]|nr:TIGR02099 family protein [Thalassotalea sp.]